MTINSSLSLGMSYYNSTQAVWEPIIEPNEHVHQLSGLVEYVPWELSFNLNIENKLLDDGIAEAAEPTTKMVVSSSETLEMTVTKTCLTVLQDLSGAFSSALSAEGLQHPDNVAPYMVVNDTGFDVTLTLNDGPLCLHNRPASSPAASASLVRDINAVAAATFDEVLILSPGDRAMLQLRSINTSQSQTEQAPEHFLTVSIGNINKDLRLPVHKSDRRYFPLYRGVKQEPWGIISHVTTEYGSTLVTLHGVLQIENHFSTTIYVWRRSNSGELLRIGEMADGAVFNVPLHALYVERQELYFSLAGYKTSVQGVNWTERPSDYEYTKLLHCDPEQTFEPFYLTAIRKRHEIYHEITSKHTMLSAYYVIHLHPPLYVRNALPLSLFVSVAGCSVAQTLETGTEAGESLANSAESVRPATGDTASELSSGPRRGSAFIDQQVDYLDYGEKEVKPGDILHLPTVKTRVREGANRSYIVARV